MSRLLLIGVIATTTLLAPVTGVSAATKEVFFPFTQTIVNACNGEPVVVTGRLQVLTNATDTHFIVQMNFHGVNGTGAWGTIYRANDVSRTFTFEKSRGSVVTFGTQESLELISLKPANAPNFILHERITTTIDFETADIDVDMHSQTECSGQAEPI